MSGWTVDVNARSKPEIGQGNVPFVAFRAFFGTTAPSSAFGRSLHGLKDFAVQQKRRGTPLCLAVVEVPLNHRSTA